MKPSKNSAKMIAVIDTFEQYMWRRGPILMISVVVCTNRSGFVTNIIENFQRQTLLEKELIIVVNSTTMEVDGVGYTIL
jgi:hypothetical protein